MWQQLLYALGVVLVAVVIWWATRRQKCDTAYRQGRTDGWNEAVDKLSPRRQFPVYPPGQVPARRRGPAS